MRSRRHRNFNQYRWMPSLQHLPLSHQKARIAMNLRIRPVMSVQARSSWYAIIIQNLESILIVYNVGILNMLKHRSGSFDGPDNTCREFEHRIESTRSRQQKRMDCGSVFPVRMFQRRLRILQAYASLAGLRHLSNCCTADCQTSSHERPYC